MSTTRQGLMLTGAVALLAASTAVLAKPSDTGGANKVALRDQVTLGVNQWGLEITNYGSFGYDIAGSDAGGEFPRGSGYHVLFAGGFQFGTLVNGAPQVSQVEFDSEFQPGAITNGPAAVATLTATDPGASDNIVLQAAKSDDTLPSGWPSGLDIIGDAATYAVFNDLDTDLSSDADQVALGIEVSQHSFAFSKQGAQGDIVYLRFTLTNKSDQDYTDSYAEVWFDPDNGDAGNDVTGCDVETSLGYVYNADDHEDRNTAMGADFFQGPIVDDPESTVIQRGSVTFNKTDDYEFIVGDVEADSLRVLGMSAFSFYINGTDPDTDEERYNLMSGLTRDGDPRDNGPFDYAGDPVTGEGINDGAPNDKRMALITGPFTLNSGDSQDVVVAIIASEVTTSDDPLQALTVLRASDQEAQIAYNFDFIQQSPPPPPVTHAEAYDKQVVLTWDNSPELTFDNYGDRLGLGDVRVIDVDSLIVQVGEDSLGNPILETQYIEETQGYDSYDFQGYRVYRSATGESADWEFLAEYDIADGITEVRTRVFNNTLQEYEIAQLHIGSDSTLRYYYVDNDLVNGRRYYYSVTSYDYQPTETLERTLESPQGQNTVVAIPKEPTAGTDIAPVVATQDTADHVAGGSDGMVTYEMVRPELYTGNTYAVTFRDYDKITVEGDTLFATPVWDLVNATTGDTVLMAQEDQSGNPSSMMADGAMIRVVNPPFEARDWAVEPEGAIRWWSGVNAGLNLFFGGLGYGHDFFGSTLPASEVHEVLVDFRFDPSEWSNAVTYRRDLGYPASGVGTFPGQVFDMDVDPPRRLNVCYVEYDYPEKPANLQWDPGSQGNDGVDATREYLFIMNSDYVENPDSIYDDDNWGPSADVIYAYWPTLRGDHPFLETDANWRLYPNRINTPEDRFEFVPQVSSSYDNTLAKSSLKDIRVVPNPYYATSTYDTDQFNRRVKFFGLHDSCTIRIFTVAGDLVRTLEHDATSDNDAGEDAGGNNVEQTTSLEGWDLKNENGFWVASGVYIAHIEVPGVGNTFVKFAVIQGTEELGIF